ncbi:MAG: EamA family transporter [Pseudomonadota bacterium]
MKLQNTALLVMVMAIWGFNFSVIKIGLDGFPPLLLATGRFFFAAFPAVFFLPRPTCDYKWVLLFGLFSGVGQFGFLFFGMAAGMSAGLASVMLQSQVFFTLILSSIIFGEVIGKRSMFGIVLAVIGVVIIGSIQDTDTNILAVMLVLMGALCWAIANTITKQAGAINMLSFIVWSSLVPIMPLYLASYVVDGMDTVHAAIIDMTAIGFGSLMYLAYATTLLGYGIFSYMIRQHGLAKVAPFTLVVPVFGIIGSYLMFDDTFNAPKVIAIALILSGLAIIVLKPRLPSWFGRHADRQKPQA